MKTTLENSYCRPTTEAEWKLIGLYNPVQPFFVEYIKGKKRYSSRPKSSKSEIPVQHFIDLVEDRIVPWRLDEIGFVSHQFNDDCKIFQLVSNSCNLCICIYYDDTLEICLQQDSAEIRLRIATFTDLLTLIRFLK